MLSVVKIPCCVNLVSVKIPHVCQQSNAQAICIALMMSVRDPRNGEACSRFEDYCQDNTYCGGSFGNYTCRPYPQLGDACEDFRTPDLCQGESYCFEGVCTAYPVEGEPCRTSNDQCQGETYCFGVSFNNATCVSYPTLGERCSPSNDRCTEGECLRDSSNNFVCRFPPELAEGLSR